MNEKLARKGGRPPTGTPKWSEERQCWIARITFPTTEEERARGVDKRRPVPLPNIAKEDRATALLVARRLAARIQRDGIVPDATAETVNEWFARWTNYREHELKLETVRNDRGVYKHHVERFIGVKPIADVTRGDLEDVRDALDTKVRTGELSWKFAANAWGTVVKMFKDACASKRRDLRVREDNPASAVEGTDRGDTKAKQFLWPSMFLAFMRCGDVPLAWKQLLAVSTMLYTRPEETAALEWSDVRLDEGVVIVHRALDMRPSEGERMKPTKTGKPRRVPIELALRPLLAAMKKASGGKGRVVAMPPQSQLARVFRRHLEVALTQAGIDAGDLFAADATRLRIDFRRATRDSGITWRAVRDDSPAKIMHAAGHKNIATTMRYVVEADGLREGFGEPFPTLPQELIKASEVSDRVSVVLPRGNSKTSGNLWAQQDLKPSGPDPQQAAEGSGKEAGSVDSEIPSRFEDSDLPREADPVETALAAALTKATTEGRWDLVAQLAGELQARRTARARVPSLDDERRRRRPGR